MLRHSPLFQFRHGDHICVFYRSEDSLREVLTPHIADGLRRGERCFCVQKSHVARTLLFDLRFLGIDTDDAIARGALELHTEDQVYLPDKKFHPEEMMHLLESSMRDALAQGFSGFRTAGELGWAVEGRNECDQLIDYERMVDDFFPGKSAVALCQCDISAFPASVLESIIEAHHLHLTPAGVSLMHSGISIRDAGFWSEIVADNLVLHPNYYYVVQHRDSSEVIGWGTAPSFEHARQRTEELVTSVAD